MLGILQILIEVSHLIGYFMLYDNEYYAFVWYKNGIKLFINSTKLII